MQIRTRLRTNVIVTVVLSVTIACVLTLSLLRVHQTNYLAKLSGDIVAGLLERDTFSSDYLRTGNLRAKEQWYAKQGQIEALLGTVADNSRSKQGGPGFSHQSDEPGSGDLFPDCFPDNVCQFTADQP